jgi:hypothetical protein
MYSYVKENGGGGMTAKGVKKYVIRNKLTHENFKNVINTKGRMRHNMNTIRSMKHTIGTYEMILKKCRITRTVVNMRLIWEQRDR